VLRDVVTLIFDSLTLNLNSCSTLSVKCLNSVRNRSSSSRCSVLHYGSVAPCFAMILQRGRSETGVKSNNLCRSCWRFNKFFQGGGLPNSTFQMGVEPNCTNLERTELYRCCTKRVTLVPICCFVSKWHWLKDNWHQTLQTNFTFFTPCQN